ncbi:hypothetical protein RDI58_007265 [Solanum bulbocastanum]|uniref:RNase III domain-containing protein n=1 Tax=Solanum bulbocastanum TaxID=147425 RepID=A0AAN8YIQ3_SOLBU
MILINHCQLPLSTASLLISFLDFSYKSCYLQKLGTLIVSSCPEKKPSTSALLSERLTLIGNAALDLAISSYFFVTYPDVYCGKMTGLSTAYVSTENLVGVAVQHGLYKCLSRDSAILDEKEFVTTVQQEEEIVFYRGTIKEPKVLADIVESIMGAVYLDCGFDGNDVWVLHTHMRDEVNSKITMEHDSNTRRSAMIVPNECHNKGAKFGVSSFGGEGGMTSLSSNAGGPPYKDCKMQYVEQLVLVLCDPNLRENALLKFFKMEPKPHFEETLTQKRKMSPLGAKFPVCLNTTSKSTPFEHLRFASLGVICALVKVDNTEVISFLVSTEIVSRCLCTMEMGSELSKTVATFIVQKILLDDVGLNYISCLFDLSVSMRLKMTCMAYGRACKALKICLPDMLRDDTFSSCLRTLVIFSDHDWFCCIMLSGGSDNVKLAATIAP